MSNDLISRNVVMDYLIEQQVNVIIEKNKNGFVNADICDGMSSAIGAFMNFIVQLPIAYDLDTVLERLEDNMRLANTMISFDMPTYEKYLMKYQERKRCLEIAKSGYPPQTLSGAREDRNTTLAHGPLFPTAAGHSQGRPGLT